MSRPSLPARSAEPPSAPASPPLAPRPPSPPAVQYKGADLDPARGPGLGCFYTQLVVLVALLVVTPITVSAGWPAIVSMGLLIAIIVLLLFTGQTMMFLLRLVAAERGRRRPLASRTRTVGEIEAGEDRPAAAGAVRPDEAARPNRPADHGGSVRE